MNEPQISSNDICLCIDRQNDFNVSRFAHLENTDNLYIKKGIKLGLAQTNLDTTIYNGKNEKLYYAKELIDDGCLGCCYSPNTWFVMKVYDTLDNEVLHLSRGKRNPCLRLVTYGSPSLEVFTSLKQKIGAVKGILSLFRNKFNIEDESGNCVLKIHSVIGFPYAHFKILSKDKSTVLGKITKERTETHHVLSKNCVVKITFPLDLEDKIKAVLLGATLSLMSAYFED